MSIRSLSILLLKLLGLIFLVIDVTNLMNLIPYSVEISEFDNSNETLYLFSFLLKFAIDFSLILFADKILTFIKEVEDKLGSTTLSDQSVMDFGSLKEIHILYAALIVIGTILSINAIPGVLFEFFHPNLRYTHSAHQSLLSRSWLGFYTQLGKLIIGMAILYKAGPLAQWLLNQNKTD